MSPFLSNISCTSTGFISERGIMRHLAQLSSGHPCHHAIRAAPAQRVLDIAQQNDSSVWCNQTYREYQVSSYSRYSTLQSCIQHAPSLLLAPVDNGVVGNIVLPTMHTPVVDGIHSPAATNDGPVLLDPILQDDVMSDAGMNLEPQPPICCNRGSVSIHLSPTHGGWANYFARFLSCTWLRL